MHYQTIVLNDQINQTIVLNDEIIRETLINLGLIFLRMKSKENN